MWVINEWQSMRLFFVGETLWVSKTLESQLREKHNATAGKTLVVMEALAGYAINDVLYANSTSKALM